jgi:hypothetical protein
MAEYNFMKSGANLVKPNRPSKIDIEEELKLIVVVFMDNALQTAGKYVKHCKRNSITSEDLRRAFMLEIFFRRIRKDNNVKRDKMREIVKDITDEERENEEVVEVELEEEDEDAFCESSCDCPLCVSMNNIYEKWEKFKPENVLERILSKHISNIK